MKHLVMLPWYIVAAAAFVGGVATLAGAIAEGGWPVVAGAVFTAWLVVGFVYAVLGSDD